MVSVWERLRSRKIVEWVVGYLAGAFGLLQIADVLEGAFSWPAVALRVLTVVIAFGFFAVLVIAWYHGEKGHQRMQFMETVLLAGLMLGTVATSWYVARTTPPAAGSVVAPPARETGDGRVALLDPATARQSVAVLPFTNMTPDQDNDYITDGITEDIISEIGKIEGLRVISRTSVQHYRNTEKTIPEIGQELGVGVILEGSVRVQGDQVRIVAQLIDVATDSHIWTATYDRGFSDMFAVQTEVAQQIAGALDARLAPASLASNTNPEIDPEAWRQYMRGRTLSNSSKSEDRRLAEVHLDSAITLAPDFAPALAALANLKTPVTIDEETGMPTASADDETIRTAERAVALDPNLADAQSSLAMVRAIRTRNLDDAEASAREAIKANPNSVRARLRYAQILFADGRREEAAREAAAAASLDPLSSQVHTHVAEYALSAGQTKQAEAHLKVAMQLDSSDADAHVTMASLFRTQGRIDDEVRELERASSMDPDDAVIQAQLATAFATAGRVEEAQAIADRLEKLVKQGRPLQALIAPVYMSMGDVDVAVDWIRQANDAGRRSLFIMPPRQRRAFDQMLEDPRIAGRLDSLGIHVTARTAAHRAPGEVPRPPDAPVGGRSGR